MHAAAAPLSCVHRFQTMNRIASSHTEVGPTHQHDVRTRSGSVLSSGLADDATIGRPSNSQLFGMLLIDRSISSFRVPRALRNAANGRLVAVTAEGLSALGLATNSSAFPGMDRSVIRLVQLGLCSADDRRTIRKHSRQLPTKNFLEWVSFDSSRRQRSQLTARLLFLQKCAPYGSAERRS